MCLTECRKAWNRRTMQAVTAGQVEQLVRDSFQRVCLCWLCGGSMSCSTQRVWRLCGGSNEGAFKSCTRYACSQPLDSNTRKLSHCMRCTIQYSTALSDAVKYSTGSLE